MPIISRPAIRHEKTSEACIQIRNEQVVSSILTTSSKKDMAFRQGEAMSFYTKQWDSMDATVLVLADKQEGTA